MSRTIALLTALLIATLAAPATAQTPVSPVGANLQGKNLQNADLHNANLQNADLQGANLRGANLAGANLRGANMLGAHLGAANLTGAILQTTNLQHADAESANFQNANLQQANLQGADLQNATLTGAGLNGVNLTRANLFGANLHSADLQNANLHGANLHNATLADANLQHADLQFANLIGANLAGAKLQSANLYRAQRTASNAVAAATPAPSSPSPARTFQSAPPIPPASIATPAPGQTFIPSTPGEIPILFNNHYVYANDVMRANRVLAALVQGETILVPLRAMLNQMGGADVSYDPGSQMIDVKKPGAHIELTIGVPRITVNGKVHPLDVGPMIYEGEILVPLRVISEGLGAYVQWLQYRRLVVVRYGELAAMLPTSKPAAPTPVPTPVRVARTQPTAPPIPTPPPKPTPAPKWTPPPKRILAIPTAPPKPTPPPKWTPPPNPTPVPVGTPVPSRTSAPLSTPAPTTTPTPKPGSSATPAAAPTTTPAPPVIAARHHNNRVILSADYLNAPAVSNELAPARTVGNQSVAAQMSYLFGGSANMYLVQIDYKRYRFPHNAFQQSVPCSPAPAGCSTVNGDGTYVTGTCPAPDPGCVTAVAPNILGAQTGRAQEYISAFNATDTDVDLRAAVKILSHTYFGVGIYYKHYDYLGYPAIRGAGFGISKTPNLDKQLSLFASVWYYPAVNGKYSYPTSPFLGPFSGQTVPFGYSVLKYRAGATFWLNQTSLFFEAGFAGEVFNSTINTPGNAWSEGSFFGIGTRFP